MTGDATHPVNAMLLGPGVYEAVSEMSPLSDSVLSGVLCCHETCLSRPKIVFWVVSWVTGYVSNDPVVASTFVSTWCLLWQVCGSVIQPVCQASPY